MRPYPVRSALGVLALGFSLVAVGCSGGWQPGSQAPVQEADKETMLKNAEARKQRMKTAKAGSPRSKQGSRD